MKLRILVLVLCFLPLSSMAAQGGNKTYWTVLQTTDFATSDGNYFFTWLGCLSCHMLEQNIDLNGYEVLPLIARPDWRPAAKIQMTLDLLAIEAAVRRQFIAMIEQNKVDVKSLDSMVTALVALGVDKTMLEQTLTGKELFTKISQAESAAKQYQIQYVPTVVVKGKYATDARHTQSVAKFSETLKKLENK